MQLYLHQEFARAQTAEVTPGDATEVAELTRRMKTGNEDAYRRFYEAYYDRLWRYLLVVAAGDEEAAREALQAALVRVVRHIKVFADEQMLWSWLTVLARTSLSDQNRKRRRYLAFLDRFTWHERVTQTEQENADADARLLNLLESNLATLPPDDKQLVEWKYLKQRSIREIAAELRSSEKAVESRLGRVRRKLKEALLNSLKNE